MNHLYPIKKHISLGKDGTLSQLYPWYVPPFPQSTGLLWDYGFQYIISHVQQPVHQTCHTEIVNKILHLRVKVMSHRGEASAKHDRKVRDFCLILSHLTILFLNCIFILFFLNHESWILDLESWVLSQIVFNDIPQNYVSYVDPLEIASPETKTPGNSALFFLGHPSKFHFVFN